MLLGWYNKGASDGQGMWHVKGRGEMHTEFWWGNLKERDT